LTKEIISAIETMSGTALYIGAKALNLTNTRKILCHKKAPPKERTAGLQGQQLLERRERT